MNNKELDMKIALTEAHLDTLKEDRDSARATEQAKIFKVKNDFFVKALPKIFKAYVTKRMSVWVQEEFESLEKTKEELQDDAYRIYYQALPDFQRKNLDALKRGDTSRKDPAIFVSEVRGLIRSVLVETPEEAKFRREEMTKIRNPNAWDLGEVTRIVVETYKQLQKMVTLKKRVVLLSAEDFINGTPGIIRNTTDKMSREPQFQELILHTSPSAKAHVLNSFIKMIKNEPDTEEDRTEALDEDDEELEECVASAMAANKNMTREEAVAYCREHYSRKSVLKSAEEIFRDLQKRPYVR